MGLAPSGEEKGSHYDRNYFYSRRHYPSLWHCTFWCWPRYPFGVDHLRSALHAGHWLGYRQHCWHHRSFRYLSRFRMVLAPSDVFPLLLARGYHHPGNCCFLGTCLDRILITSGSLLTSVSRELFFTNIFLLKIYIF